MDFKPENVRPAVEVGECAMPFSIVETHLNSNKVCRGLAANRLQPAKKLRECSSAEWSDKFGIVLSFHPGGFWSWSHRVGELGNELGETFGSIRNCHAVVPVIASFHTPSVLSTWKYQRSDYLTWLDQSEA